MNSSFPTRFQSKTLWSAITMASIITIGALSVGLIWLFTWVMGVLQPILVPFAVAGVLAYLLYPLVDRLISRGLPQKRASLIVFLSFLVGSGLLFTAITIPVTQQAAKLAKDFPGYVKQFEEIIDSSVTTLKNDYSDHSILGPFVSLIPDFALDTPVVETTLETAPTGVAGEPASSAVEFSSTPAVSEADDDIASSLDPISFRSWILKQVPVVATNLFNFVKRSVGGFLGAFGFVLGLFLVPLYLFFFLREAPSIRTSWSDYLPLKASKFKDDVVDTLTDINGYLIAFFRGQMLVSLIDGAITAILLSALGLKFALLIGVLVGLLGIIPYIGILMCFVPAVIIATVQGAQHDWYISSTAPWWVLPLVVSIVFLAVNNLDGILIAPKIVGDSVGLHPFTVIFSVLFWSSLLGGLLGAILAVPLTASIKVLFYRFIWSRRLNQEPPDVTDKPDPEPA